MSQTNATLVLGADFSQLLKAKQALSETAKEGAKTEKAVGGTKSGFDKAGRGAAGASVQFDKFGKSADRARGMALAGTKALAGMAVALGSVVAAGLSIGKFVSATVEAERVQAQLGAAL